VSFQPAELAKLALVIYLAAFVARRGDDTQDVRRTLVPPLLVAGAFAALVLLQPDLGNCLTLVALTFGVLYIAGTPAKYLAWIVAPAVPLLALAIWVAPYRPAPHHRVLGSVVGSARQRLSDHPVVAGLRQRRPDRAGHRRLAAEALLPAGVAHRLHLRRGRRGAGVHRRRRAGRALRRC
jgi:cell division protein FtsW (lipid II flippase)